MSAGLLGVLLLAVFAQWNLLDALPLGCPFCFSVRTLGARSDASADKLTWISVELGILDIWSMMLRTIFAVLALGMTAKNGRSCDNSSVRALASCCFT
jgi:hypothetical protein